MFLFVLLSSGPFLRVASCPSFGADKKKKWLCIFYPICIKSLLLLMKVYYSRRLTCFCRSRAGTCLQAVFSLHSHSDVNTKVLSLQAVSTQAFTHAQPLVCSKKRPMFCFSVWDSSKPRGRTRVKGFRLVTSTSHPSVSLRL